MTRDLPTEGRSASPTTDTAWLDHEQLEALTCLARGMTIAAAARQLGVSERTVRRRLRALCDELNLTTTIQAVVWAAKSGYL